MGDHLPLPDTEAEGEALWTAEVLETALVVTQAVLEALLVRAEVPVAATTLGEAHAEAERLADSVLLELCVSEETGVAVAVADEEGHADEDGVPRTVSELTAL